MMTWTDFYDRVEGLGKNRHKAIWISPRLDFLPLPIQRYDEPFFPLGKAIIQATQANAGIYIFDLASYFATGAAGIVALERTIAYARDTSVTVLHGSFTGQQYSILADDISLNIDSFTVTLASDLEHYLENPPYSAFWWNGVLDDRGGVITQEKLTLVRNGGIQLDIPIIHSSNLLTDLTDTFIDTIKQQII